VCSYERVKACNLYPRIKATLKHFLIAAFRRVEIAPCIPASDKKDVKRTGAQIKESTIINDG